MSEKEIMEHLMVIYGTLEKLTTAVKLLLDDSIQREREIFPNESKLDRECREFFEGIKHGKDVE